MGYPNGIPPSPPQGGGGARVVPTRFFINIKKPRCYHSGAVVLLIPFLASFLLHNHIRSNYLLQHLVDIVEVFDLQEVIRILF